MRMPVMIEMMNGMKQRTKPIMSIAAARLLNGLSALVLSFSVFLVVRTLKNPAIKRANPRTKSIHMRALHHDQGVLFCVDWVLLLFAFMDCNTSFVSAFKVVFIGCLGFALNKEGSVLRLINFGVRVLMIQYYVLYV